ncbi:MAG: phytanoyl-CoA dioxygenase family protein [Phycisphaeraceae bacterium]
MASPYRVLSDADVEHFLEHGYVLVKGCFPRDVADEWVAHGFTRLGYDPADPSTWAESRIHMGSTKAVEVKDFSPRAWGAVCDLLGGEERVAQPARLSDGLIFNLNDGADEPWQPPSPALKGWHKDGDFFRHFLDSPEQGLLTLVCWSDVRPRSGATFVATDSVAPVARCLADNPQGLLPKELPSRELIGACSRFTEAVAEAGDIFLLHPYILHASSQNEARRPRVISNPPMQLKEPMNFNREDPADFSPVERAGLRGLGVERYAFVPTGERETFVPERVLRQRERMEQEKARLAQS